MLSLILTIIQIFFMLPKIWETIKTIMELIKAIREASGRAAARKELKSILERYRHVNRKDKEQVKMSGDKLKVELEQFADQLRDKIKNQETV